MEKSNQEPQDTIDEERKRRAFMNALSNMYLFEEALQKKEQDSKDESSKT